MLLKIFLCNIIILVQQKFCQAVTWAIGISKKGFCIQNVPLDSNTNNIRVKMLKFLDTFYQIY